MSQQQYDTEAILAATDLVTLVGRYTELKQKGREYVGKCVNHSPDNHPSMYVVPEKGFVTCFGCGWTVNAITFLQHVEQIDFKESCKRLLNGSGTTDPENKAPKRKLVKPAPRKTFAPPPDTEAPDMKIKALGEPTAVYDYHAATGEIMGYVARYKDGDGKTMRCWSWGSRADDDPAKWECGHFAAPRPLYNLHNIHEHPNSQVMLVEGEKTADAAQRLFPGVVAATWPAGAMAIDRVDWTQLNGRKVVLVPDADEPGRQAMSRIAAYLYENGAIEVKGVDSETQPDWTVSPEGWDLADALADGWTPDEAMAWAKARVTVYPKPLNEPPSQSLPKDQPIQEPKPADAAAAQINEPQAKSEAMKPDLGVVDGNTVRKPKRQEIDPEAELPPEFSESGMARAWVDEHGKDWKYTAKWKAWHKWDGKTWARDEKNSITWTIDEHCRKQQADAYALTPTQKNRICTIKNFNAINHLSGANPICAITPDQWDANPMMLGTPDGVVDLTRGKLIEAERDQLISRKTSVSPKEGPHPWWDSVLARAHKGDPAVASFIHRWCGYLLTGDTREERFLFVHGAGGGGKSKFLTPLVEIMADYCCTAKMESFTAKEKNEHSEEIARLAGARLVTASETEDGARWNESRIKQLTGRDKISARHMHQSTFEFQPQFKLVFIGNHRPALRSVGEEMRRRIDLLEWSGSIPDEERILDLPERLKLEYPAILHWMVQGCILWQEQGLGRPATITAATDEYLSAEDTLGAWMDDRITLASPDYKTLIGDLYLDFKRWAEKQGEFVLSQKRFSQKVEDRGFQRYRDSKGRYFKGIDLKIDI